MIITAKWPRKASRFSPKKILLTLLIVCCTGVFAYNAAILVRWYIDSRNITEEAAEVEEIAEATEINGEGELVNPPAEDDVSDYWYYIKLPFMEVDLAELRKLNPDTVGFLSVAGTNINYPVVQTGDNKYYLTRTFKRQYNQAGWVFMDYRNHPGFTDQNTVIYGHGRLDTTMFGTLKNILSSAWVDNKDNYVIRYSSESENMLLQVFSVYTVPAESYYIQTRFGSSEYQGWLGAMIGRSQHTFGTTINAEDKVLTLSTCSNTEGERIVMHAKLIKKMRKT